MTDTEQVACHKCQSQIMDPQYIKTVPHIYHLSCFTCDKCQSDLSSQQFSIQNDQNICKTCYLTQFAYICTSCKEQITDKFVMANEQYFHPEHFTCETCAQTLEGDKFYFYEQKRYCRDCFIKVHGGVCDSCKELITDTAYKACNQTWHQQCLLCSYCKQTFQDLNFIECQSLLYHEECWDKKSKGEATAAVLEELKQEKVEEQKTSGDTYEQAQTEEGKIKAQEAAAEEKEQEEVAKQREDEEAAVVEEVKVLEQTEAKQKEDEEAEAKRLPHTEEEQKQKQAEDQAADKKQADEEEETKKAVNEESNAAEGGGSYSYEQLTKGDLPAGVDPNSKEIWLNEDDFRTRFGMDKAAFAQLPKWKQVVIKKKLEFF